MSSVGAMAQTRFIAILAAGAILATVAVGCGDDDDTTSADAAAVDVERYCEIATEELAAAAQEEVVELRRNPELTKGKDYAVGERNLLQENRELFVELQRVAPLELREELGVIIADARVRAGLSDEALDPATVDEAVSTVGSFEQESCRAGGQQ